jgi:hypothetical protein
MKNIIFHIIPIFLSFLWLFFICHTWNPVSLRGPYFLNFYLILILGFYLSVFILKSYKNTIPKITFYFMISIFLLGIIKLIRGILLGKPVGFLIMILIAEVTVMLLTNYIQLNQKIK